MWPSMVVIVIVDGVDVALCVAPKFSRFFLPALTRSLCFSLFGTSFSTPAFRYVSRPHLASPYRPDPPNNSPHGARCQPENVNLSHEHVRIFSMRLGLGDDLFFGCQVDDKGRREGGEVGQRNVLRVLAEKWHDCFIANVVMLKCRTQIS